MEYGVHGLHSIEELECEGVGSRSSNDCEGSEVLVRELLRGAHRPEILGFHINFITYFEVWRS